MQSIAASWPGLSRPSTSSLHRTWMPAQGRHDGSPFGRTVAMLEEFKKFALRGNVVDLAIGVIIGAAFGGIVQVAGRRRHHADDRRGHRRARFFELLPPALARRSRPARLPRQKSKALYWLGAISSPSRLTSSSSLSCCFWRSAPSTGCSRKEAEKAPPPSKPKQLLTEIRDRCKSR